MDTITSPAAPRSPAARYRWLEPAPFSLLIPALGWYDHVQGRADVPPWIYLPALVFAVAAWFGRDRPQRIGLGVIGCVLAWRATDAFMTVGLFAWALHGVD
ncbi:hypothetical protein ACFXDJ_32885 [Streptomyces sp. NPDC059443]|uniref:hypothetical protein n=1 Tax=unclassified Streptomyces TaxID=2593676 RepID=UPI0036C58C2F